MVVMAVMMVEMTTMMMMMTMMGMQHAGVSKPEFARLCTCMESADHIGGDNHKQHSKLHKSLDGMLIIIARPCRCLGLMLYRFHGN